MPSASLLCAGAVALAVTGSVAAAAENYLYVKLRGPMTPEIRAALARVVAPSAAAATATTEFARAAEGALTVDQFCRRIDCDGIGEGTSLGIDAIAEARLPASVEEGIERLQLERNSDRFASPPGTVVPSVRVPTGPILFPGRASEDFLIVRPDSDLFAAHRDTFARAGVDGAETAIVPVPEDAASLAPDVVEQVFGGHGTHVSGTIATGPIAGAVLLDDRAAQVIATLEADLEASGTTARTIPIAPGASPEAIAAFEQAVAALEQEVALRGGSAAAVDTPRRDVDIDWTVGGTEQSSTGAPCGAAHERWPFDAARVRDILAFDLKVLEATGQSHPRRSNILIVDSGIDPALARASPVRPFLFADTGELLSHGHFFTGNDIFSPKCEDPDGETTDNAYGHVPRPEIRERKLCSAEDPIGHLAPPSPQSAGPTYRPGHGGFVGGIAAGGRDLMESGIGVDRLVGVSFARIFWTDNAGALRSDAPDVAEAIRYATRKGVDVVNASLKVRNAADEEIGNAIRAFGNSGGLVVAAAGNSPELLTEGSESFPASIAPPDGADWIIVVGGMQRRPGSGDDMMFWPKSSFSASLVDIAAPAADIASFDRAGGEVCDSGTSAAAPQVSFVAGVLRAFGYRPGGEVKRRILATADHADDLEGKVRGRRKLNVANALDVFVDLVWLKGAPAPLRVHLRAERDGLPIIIQACDEDGESLAGDKGRIDAARLILWRRVGGGTAEVWHRAASTGITRVDNQCLEGAGMVHFTDLADGLAGEDREKELPLSEIDRIVPSRLRAALPVARAIILGE